MGLLGSRLVTVVGASAIVGLAGGTGVADAALPHFKNHAIAINRSLGGLTLGEPRSAVSSWGTPNGADEGEDEGSEDWSSRPVGPRHSPVDRASVSWVNTTPLGDTANEVIAEISLVSRDPLHSKLRSVKTSKRIGIGSTLKAARKAYPHAIFTRDTSSLFFSSGKVGTEFTFSHRLLVEIDLNARRKYAPPPPPFHCVPMPQFPPCP